VKAVLKVVVLSLVLLAAAGCGTLGSALKKPQPDQQLSRDEKQIQVDLGLAERAKSAAATVKGVRESAAVALGGDISVAIKVSGFDRLRLKRIKAEVHDRVKELNKDCNVHVTTDKKIFKQLRQVEEQIKEPREKSLTDIQKKVEKINKDIQG